MFDTMTFTKAAGGLCGALLVLLLGKWAAEELFHVGGHGEPSFVVEVEGEVLWGASAAIMRSLLAVIRGR